MIGTGHTERENDYLVNFMAIEKLNKQWKKYTLTTSILEVIAKRLFFNVV